MWRAVSASWRPRCTRVLAWPNYSRSSASTTASQASSLSKNPAQVLDGKHVASQWLEELGAEVQQLQRQINRPPSLAVIVVGSRPDSLLYVTRKQEACCKAGVHVRVHHLPETVSQSQLQHEVSSLSQDPGVDGLLVQLPLPCHLCEETIMEHIDPKKDVDGFHPLNMGRMLMRGRVPRLIPCTPLGCMELLQRTGWQVAGRSAVVVGDSNIVGTPLAALLRDQGAAAVTVCHQPSYQEWFESDVDSQHERAEADACLPRLPGPQSVPSNTLTKPGGGSNSINQSSNISISTATPVVSHSTTLKSNGGVGTGGACPPEHQDHDRHNHATAGSEASSSDTANEQMLHKSARSKQRSETCCLEGSTPTAITTAGTNEDARLAIQATVTAEERCITVGDRSACFQAKHLPGITRSADILVVAVGVPHLIKADWVKPGAIVLDVGINVIPPPKQSKPPSSQTPQHQSVDTKARSHDTTNEQDSKGKNNIHSSSYYHDGQAHRHHDDQPHHHKESGHKPDDVTHGSSQPPAQQGLVNAPSFTPGTYQVVGDVDFEEVSTVAAALTPVPGGIGPMTIAAVLHNTIRAAKYNAGLLEW